MGSAPCADAPRSTVVIHTDETRLSVHNGCLALERSGARRALVPAPHVAELLVYGSWTLTTPVMALASRHQFPISFFSEGGEWIGRLETESDSQDPPLGEGPTFDALQSQWRAADDPAVTLGFARRFAAGKIHNQRALLASVRGRLDDRADRAFLAQAAASLRRAARAITNTETLESLRGYEGDAARHYYPALARTIAPALRIDFPFPRRTRRPPLDPFNALLSYLYALLYHDSLTALRHVGLETRLGFLHARHHGRHSLACDLMEELRPLQADRFALALVNRRQLRPEHFTRHADTGAVHLNPDGRRILFAARGLRQRESIHSAAPHGTTLLLWQDVPRHQARLLANALRHSNPAHYTPFAPRL